jgi:hypothetical protein
MIRPVLYVDLPGIVYALDQRARARQSAFADFVIASEPEPRSGPAALLNALWPITPTAHTWLCEDRWHLLGLAQARTRPGNQAWDLTYLAAMTSPGGQAPTIAPDDVLYELAQYALNAAILRGVQRFFTHLDDGCSALELLNKLGFQRYARELTYILPAIPAELAAGDDSTSPSPLSGPRTLLAALHSDGESTRGLGGIQPDVPLRPWHRHDAWGLQRLYDACTPRRVQIAESLTCEELLHTRAGGGYTWHIPLIEPAGAAFVLDRGVRLGGWLRLRFGRGSQPHQLWLLAHPDESDVPAALVRFGVRVLAQHGQRPVVCRIREYEGASIDALRAAGFEHAGTRALLVRHLTMRALRKREVPALEPRMVYGVRGLGTAQTRLSKGEKIHYATRDH